MDANNPLPDFLALPSRPPKPRRTGVSHVIDRGLNIVDTRATLDAVSDMIDIWKFGWGTSYLDTEVAGKLELLRSASVLSCTGGTLIEIAWVQERTNEFFDWVQSVGIDCVEVSNGATSLPISAKRELMGTATERGLIVLSEVGSKDPSVPVVATEWAEEMAGDLDAGARWVVAEGRESGTVGLYNVDGTVRQDVVDTIESVVDPEQIIYEAPHRAQQAAHISRVGPSVNLGNIAPTEVMALETLRVGLRTDTLGLSTTVGTS